MNRIEKLQQIAAQHEGTCVIGEVQQHRTTELEYREVDLYNIPYSHEVYDELLKITNNENAIQILDRDDLLMDVRVTLV